MLQKEPLPEFLNSGPGPPLTTCRAWPPRYDVAPARATRRASDGMSNGVYVRRGIHVGHTSARPDEDNVRARMRAQSRVRWFERKAITRSGARERRPLFATALAERAHERARARRGGRAVARRCRRGRAPRRGRPRRPLRTCVRAVLAMARRTRRGSPRRLAVGHGRRRLGAALRLIGEVHLHRALVHLARLAGHGRPASRAETETVMAVAPVGAASELMCTFGLDWSETSGVFRPPCTGAPGLTRGLRTPQIPCDEARLCERPSARVADEAYLSCAACSSSPRSPSRRATRTVPRRARIKTTARSTRATRLSTSTSRN